MDRIADIKLIPAICPRCGANLNLPKDLKTAYCTYCGTEILIGQSSSEQKVECKMCEGYGRVDYCRVCDGSGHCTWSTQWSGSNQDLLLAGYSSHCENGICHACGGSGRYILSVCPGCSGTGKCPGCLGSGKCPSCKGIGMTPSPMGADKCPLCGGAGLINPGRSQPLEALSVCSECKRPMPEDAVFCTHCGFKRNRCPQCGTVWVTGRLSCIKCGNGQSES